MTELNKDQILNFMIDCLGLYSDQDRLETETRDSLWNMLSETEKIDCEAFNESTY